ncbi:hypothetical protein AWB95_08400 [Mycobacterium celatum]|uniref:Uncharacterized protein n=1 Tax=Mycobacterium celatum TaxID=28045 RepID=A0A1X1RSB3_MYCCE|nr:hypothetical protein AWB95_08400 [Mycobacterium celatum]PIB78060.1 hypothetical protein CQY23_15900 [Mycobacterium celatum]
MTVQGFSASTEQWNGANGFGTYGWWLISTSTSLLPLAIVIATALRLLPQCWSPQSDRMPLSQPAGGRPLL